MFNISLIGQNKAKMDNSDKNKRSAMLNHHKLVDKEDCFRAEMFCVQL